MCGDWQEVSPTSAGGVVSPMNGDETPAQMKAKLEGVVGKLRDLLAKHKALLVSRLIRNFCHILPPSFPSQHLPCLPPPPSCAFVRCTCFHGV